MVRQNSNLRSLRRFTEVVRINMGHRFGFLKKKVCRTSIWEEWPVRSETGTGFMQRASNNFVLMERIHYGLVYGETAVAGGWGR